MKWVRLRRQFDQQHGEMLVNLALDGLLCQVEGGALGAVLGLVHDAPWDRIACLCARGAAKRAHAAGK